MAIIGKLLKKTNEISYKKKFKKGKEYNNQLRTLHKLVDKAKFTKFGNTYHFEGIVISEKIVEDFQQTVPITYYEEFHDKWLAATIEGEKNHTWPGKINHFALSSGTTGSSSKRIPVSKQMIRSFHKTSMNQTSTFYKLNLSDEFYEAKFLAIGGSTKLKKVGNHFEGDLSGILKKNTSFIFHPFTKPNNNIAKIADWNKKLEKIIEKAPSWDIGIIAGVPSWCLIVMERIIEHYQLKNIHEIWPNLNVYLHGGVYMEPYKARLDRILGNEIHLLNTYLASEGYFAYQTSPEREGMQLLLGNGIFYEFIPFNRGFFDENGNLKNKNVAFNLSQVEPGVDYAMVITTNAGLWRYMIGDLVQFTDVENYEIKITGRIKQFLSLVGEHLSLDNINEAINHAGKVLNIEIDEFCIIADNENCSHNWYIGTKSNVDELEIMKVIDEKLKLLNDDYKTCRAHNLKNPTIKILSTTLFYAFLERNGKTGSQNKFPRVLSQEQSKNWLNFIKKK
jgi:hypothetical protein